MGRADSPLRDRLVFLVGARRSGTNWLRRVVDAHPDIAVIPGETYLFSHGLQPLADRVQHGIAGSARTGFVFMERQAFLDAARTFCDELFSGLLRALDVPAGGLIAERTPDHVRHLALIGSIYPDASVVHIIRDGRDVARSLLSQPWGPADMTEAAREWRTAVEDGRQQSRDLVRYREIRYEDLLGDTRRQVEGLFDWLRVDTSAPVVEAALTEAGISYNTDPSAPRVGTEKWRGDLDPAQLHAFSEEAGELLEELGYPAGDETGPTGPSRLDRPSGAARRSGRAVAGPLRQAAERARSAAAALRTGAVSLERRVLDRLDVGQAVADEFMGALARQDFAAAARRLAVSGHVRLDAPERSWQGRGDEARDRLREWLAGDDALRGRQVRAAVHPGVPSFTIEAIYETDDGARHRRGFVLGFSGDHDLVEVGIYR